MSNQSLSQRVEENLKQAIHSGLLPDFVQSKAETLLGRIQKPVRVALLGMPGAGKSSVLNLLVGTNLIKEGSPLPSLQLIYGDTPQSICTLADGTKQVLDTVDTEAIASLSPVFVEMRMPLPALTKISLLETATPADPIAVKKASEWAAKRCDMAIWCTRGYLEVEQQIWSTMPDMIKDHGFCLLTRADLLEAEGLLETALRTVEANAADEFAHVLAIGTTAAIAARKPDGSVDKDQLRQSGGMALISAVKRQVDQGKQSAVDMADVLLHQYADALEAPAQTMPPAVTEPEPEVEEPAPPAEQPSVAEPEISQKPEPTPEPAPEVAEPEPAPAKSNIRLAVVSDRSKAPAKAPDAGKKEPLLKPVATGAKPDAISKLRAIAQKNAEARKSRIVGLSPETRAAYETVIRYLEEQAASMATMLAEKGDSAPAQIMAKTVTHIQWLCDYLNENGNDDDKALQRARDTAFDAADMVQLMQLEQRDSAALEAVSIMLQVKRELQADLAA